MSDFQHIFAQTITGGRQFFVLFCTGSIMPWCIRLDDNSTYWRTIPELMAYAHGRGWVSRTQADALSARIQDLALKKGVGITNG